MQAPATADTQARPAPATGWTPAPHWAVHLKEISWDHQKPATLIAGILFLVSFAKFLQVFLVISQGLGGWSLYHHCVPQPRFLDTWPSAMTPNKSGASRLPSDGAIYGQDMGYLPEGAQGAPRAPRKEPMMGAAVPRAPFCWVTPQKWAWLCCAFLSSAGWLVLSCGMARKSS